jgi:pectinesterase
MFSRLHASSASATVTKFLAAFKTRLARANFAVLFFLQNFLQNADPKSGANVYVNGAWEDVDGASLSSPLALGVCARLISANSKLGLAPLRQILLCAPRFAAPNRLDFHIAAGNACPLRPAPAHCYPMRTAILLALLFLPILAHAQDVPDKDVHVRVSPDVTTGIEGTTEFPTIQMALDHHPFPAPGGRVFIEIAPGTYHERLNITQNHSNITLLGMGLSPQDVVITNSLNAKQAGGTFFTETVEVSGSGFEADNVTFENTAGNTGQAVAVAVRADRSVFKRCRFLGHQDTLFADYGRQYYVDSYIEGGVDFIFGNAAAVFDHTEIHANGPGYLTAQSRTSADQRTGYVVLDSKVTSGLDPHSASDARHTGIFLGRPWRPYSRVVYIDAELPADVRSEGWNNWNNPANERTAWYAEFNNKGPGADPSVRVLWSHQLTAAEAKQFYPRIFLAGTDHWNPIAAAAKLP